MSSTACFRASSKEDAFLIVSSTSRSTSSRRWADFFARLVFQGLSSSRVNAMFTSATPFEPGCAAPAGGAALKRLDPPPAIQAQHVPRRIRCSGGEEHHGFDD